MLDYIRVKNLRSLEDTGRIKISPITILLGENSSGKSTYLRTFPLLKQSAETTTRSSILWYGKYVDFGDFDQALNRNHENGEIGFSFGLTVPKSILIDPFNWARGYKRESPTSISTAQVSVTLRLASRGKDGLTRTAGFQIQLEDNIVDISVNEQGRIVYINVNGIDYSDYAEQFIYSPAARLLPGFSAKQDEAHIFGRWKTRFAPLKLRETILKKMGAYMHGKTGMPAINLAYQLFRVGSSAQMLNYFHKASSTATWKSRTLSITVNNPEFRELRDLVILAKLPSILPEIDEVLSETFRRVSYTAPLRASAERYYRSQDLSVGELDSKGENLAMFVRNLSEREKINLDDWMRKEFGFKLEVKYSGGHVTAGIEYEGSGESFNLADMGFGFSQVMPIIVQVWTLINKQGRQPNDGFSYTYLIEQPELHLHPRLQAKLAEALIRATLQAHKHGLKINLILETHSEAIVNKVGLMMNKGEVRSDDASIIIFSKETEKSKTLVKLSKFDENGILTNWPYGFFDIEI